MNIIKLGVVGYHHSGTTILRKIIGNHEDVFDTRKEKVILEPPEEMKDETHYVFKKPRVQPRLWTKELILIGICRDFRDVYVSCQRRNKKRFTFDIVRNKYIEQNNIMLDSKENFNIKIVRYEDLFDEDYKTLQEIFQFCKLNFYPELVTENDKRVGYINGAKKWKAEYKNYRSKNNCGFRMWQINQPFEQKSGAWKQFLSEDERIKIAKDDELIEIVQKLGYTWKKFLTKYK